MGETHNDTDVSCMLRLKEGEDLALNELMDRWQQRVANYIMRFVGNQADAIDLAQETFVRVYENRHRYEPRAAFSTWLFQIATNLSRNHARWRSRHPSVPLEVEQDDGQETERPEAVTHDPAPLDGMIQKEQADCVRNAIQELSAESRTIVLLFEYEGLSYREIGAILKCSEKAVETRLYRARQTLREKLLKQKDITL